MVRVIETQINYSRTIEGSVGMVGSSVIEPGFKAYIKANIICLNPNNQAHYFITKLPFSYPTIVCNFTNGVSFIGRINWCLGERRASASKMRS